ncbi:uncharacterized protein F4817DRAFT_356515 [Daldinia loculata]|uniref:uncharacterized protein n=1 Tax=Daldinia loculata TaxID=103429 RepID=UPI0020C55691|nr:uncharacterized protein F4817DRAFT_356515 [Daldinia loculata]KAI1650615.1 hypothetical protein F4817DRAFT_356515 [Daldinia loculata]
MDRIPEDIIVIIASLLPSRNLALFATLSRPWQRAIERRTFSTLYINSTTNDLYVFERIVWANCMRRKFPQSLTFSVQPYIDKRRVKPPQHWQHFSASLTWDLRRLFLILAESDDENKMTLKLVGNIRDDEKDDGPEYLRPRLALIDNADHFPVVKCVSKLVCSIANPRPRIALRAAINIAKLLPSLGCIEITAREVGFYKAAVRREDEHGLADALVEANFLSGTECREVSLCLDWNDPYSFEKYDGWVVPDRRNSPSYDPLGAAVRTWSYNLVSLKVCGVFDGSLFWPSESERLEMPVLPWPCLREFYVNLGIVTPAGGWYFINQPDSHKRNVPCEETMQPLFVAWAKALESMPVLQQAALRFRVIDDSEQYMYNWLVGIRAPGTGPRRGKLEGYSHKSRLIFKNTKG